MPSAQAQELLAEFEDGRSGRVDYRTLRLESPSAEVQGHGGGPKPPPPIVPDDIRVVKAEPVGRYAVRLFFRRPFQRSLHMEYYPCPDDQRLEIGHSTHQAGKAFLIGARLPGKGLAHRRNPVGRCQRERPQRLEQHIVIGEGPVDGVHEEGGGG